jgi:RimJ/RimL family protein N-acetyltransferase
MLPNSERLYLRQLIFEDTPCIFEIYSDKEAMKYRGSMPLNNLDEAKKMIETANKNIQDHIEYRYAIVKKEDNKLIGTFLIKPITATKCEIGYSLGKKYWGFGYANEIVQTMLIYLKTVSFETVIATTKEDNSKSIALLEKVGFCFVEQQKSTNLNMFEYKLI